MLEILATIGAFAAFVAALTQVCKVQFGLKGRAVFFVSLGIGVVLGCLFAWGGLLEFRALRDFPSLASGGVLGLLSGLGASGGKDFLTGVGRNNAKARAEYEAQYRADDCAPGSVAADPTPAGTWEDVDLATYSRTDWPAVPGLDDGPPYR